MVWNKVTSLFRRGRPVECRVDRSVVKTFRKRYARFKKLLDANAALAELMADMEEKLRGNSLFGQLYVRNCVAKAVRLARRMASSLEGMSDGRYKGLSAAVGRIESEIDELTGHDAQAKDDCLHLTLSLSELDLSMVDWVGGKNANLGEMRTEADLPVPRGFAVTVTAFHRFMAHEGLSQKVEEQLSRLDPNDMEALAALLDALREMVETAPLPDELALALDAAWHENFGDEDLRLAVRSSAQSEDGSKSFAGQFLTELNVSRAGLQDSYRKVVASIFTPSATLYRLHQGIPLSESAMAVACLEMVDAIASGVAYSHDPVDLLQDVQIINGVWGLGRYAVDGLVEPDLWVFTREEEPALIRCRAGAKDRKLSVGSDGELADMRIPAEEQWSFCLSEEDAGELARLVMKLERHYGGYQDVEWAKARDGRLMFLQSRPLDTRSGSTAPKPPLLEQYTLLLEGGDIAYPGVGCGPAVFPRTPEDLMAFPDGGVLVALHSSAEYAAVMDKAQAVLTETGGITGHMATICREFRVPTILNVHDVMLKLSPGQEVTVDAFSGRVYEGKAEELLPLRLELEPVRLQDTPVHKALRAVSGLILPLNLIDPSSPRFAPQGCKTLHDVMRYAHEKSYHEMFAISDSAVDAGAGALKLKASLPIDLHIIDLDKGVDVPPGARTVTPEQILSAPFRALLKGMLHPDVVFRKPRPINMSGFMSVMGQQMVNPQGGGERFGDKSYAIISDRYLNFSSRVGYHYSVLDAYCGNTTSKNYIAFSFQGGAAGEEQRVRRIRAIALVLEDLGFTVAIQGDSVKSRFQKYPKKSIEDRLDQLGRLLQVTRQMDMLMVNDEAVARFRSDFMDGVYR